MVRYTILVLALAGAVIAQALTVFPARSVDAMPSVTAKSQGLKGAVCTVTLNEQIPGLEGMRTHVVTSTFDVDGYETARETYIDDKRAEAVTRVYGPNHRTVTATTEAEMVKYVPGPNDTMVPDEETSTRTRKSKSEYNAQGQLVKDIEYDETGAVFEVITYTYAKGYIAKAVQKDAAGKVLFQTTFTRDQYGNLISFKSQAPNDGFGVGESSKAVYDYTSNTVTMNNGEDRYSDDGLLMQTTIWPKTAHTGKPVGVQTFTYTFDAAGNWVTRTNTVQLEGQPATTIVDTREITYHPAKK